RAGVIAGYTVRVSDDHELERIRALIMITVFPKQAPSVVEALRQMPGVRALHSVNGAWDLVAMAIVQSIGEMAALTDCIGALDGVRRSRSTLLLSTKSQRGGPLEEVRFPLRPAACAERAGRPGRALGQPRAGGGAGRCRLRRPPG